MKGRVELDKIPIKKDKRKKLSEQDKKMIRRMYDSGWSINGIARRYEVSKRTIQFLLFPERLERNKLLRRERLLFDPQRYYDKDKHNSAIKDLRERKRIENKELFEKTCPICKKKFTGQSNQIYCSKKCLWIEGNRRKRKNEKGGE